MRPTFPRLRPRPLHPVLPRSPKLGGRSVLGRAAVARVAGLLCMVGLVLTFAWPALATGQDEAAEAEILGGVYSVSIGEPDLPPGLAGGPALIGQWTLTLNEDGTYVVARQDVGVIATGTFEVSGATLTFAGWTGIVGCGGDEDGEPAEASYAWDAVGDELRLTPIQETCTDRRILFSTRAFGSYESCVTEPLAILAGPPSPAGTPVPAPGSQDVPVGPAATPSLPAAEGTPAGADVEAAIDALLRQATGCWATQDPARFLALHSQRAIELIEAGGPLASFANQMQSIMTSPFTFERIGEVRQIDPTHAWSYVEVTLTGQPPIPQRFDYVLQDGTWLFDYIFLLPPPAAQPSPQP